MMLRKLTVILILLCALSADLIMAQESLMEESLPEEKAVAAAEAWIEMIDNGLYADSWEKAAGYFKAVMKKESWEDSVRPLRESLGKVLSRTLKDFEFMTEMPGAPDGEYIVIQYETSFENKAQAIETVTPMLDPDGEWRVAGYYIK